MHSVIPIASRCSVSSVVVAPGPCVKTESRPKPDLHTAETINKQQEVVTDQQPLKTRAASSSSALVTRGGQRRSNDTCSDGPRHDFAENKQLCRQNSSVSRSWKTSRPTTQTAPSSGDCLEYLPWRVKSVDLAGERINENTNSSLSHFPNAETNQRDDPQQKLDSSVFVTMQDRNMVQDKMTGATTSDKQEGSLLAQNSSPVRTIQRRVRVYKRKWRKLETHVEHLHPCYISDDVRLKLLEIFQSSDDTDVEFLGFEG